METDNDLLSRNVVTLASADGIALEVNGEEEFRSWDSVTSVGARIVKHGDANIFVLAIVFDDDRTFIIGENEAAWPQMAELLHTPSPGVEPVSSWGPRLLAEPGIAALFEREG